MRNIIKVALLSMIVMLVGCEVEPELSTRQGQVMIDTLFTHDGCTVYRFEDGGRNIYYTKCRAGETSTTAYYTGGKHNQLVTNESSVK